MGQEKEAPSRTFMSEVPVWERQPSEPMKAFHAFAHYRDLGGDRSLDKAYRQHHEKCLHRQDTGNKRAERHWPAWSSAWCWVERVRAWDGELDRQLRERLLKDQIEARSRHARLAQGTLTTLAAPVRATLEALADPAVIQKLTEKVRGGNAGALEVMQIIGRLAQSIPSLVTVERLALGMTTESIEVEDKRDLTIANRIAVDPAATALAAELLERLAGTGAPA